MDAPQVIGMGTSHAEMIEALVGWMQEIGTTFSALDDLTGLPDRYVSKIMAPRPIKSLSRTSMGPIFEALGLRWQIVVDPAKAAEMRRRLARDRWPKARRAYQSKMRRQLSRAAKVANDNIASGMMAAGLPQNEALAGNDDNYRAGWIKCRQGASS